MIDDIAIVGMSCRFPGASNLESYWNLCWNGVDAITEVPANRWDVNEWFDPNVNAAGKTYCRWGGFIDNVEFFDTDFFGISPREAIHMDPRQRLMLETSWEALQDFGISKDKLAGSETGVFISTLTNDYLSLVFANPSNVDSYSGTGNAHCVIANRLSYFYDLKGPSLTVDTACSGSLVAAHLACQSLKLKECNLALVGGVNLILTMDGTLFFSRAGVLSKTGRCHSFTSYADGFVRSDGAGLMVLQRLEDALAENRKIYAVIKGSAVNQDGRTSGIMAPSMEAQSLVLNRAYKNANILPNQVQYIEAHGTGTILGDQIEATALCNVLKRDQYAESPCYIGSVKTNIGHTEAAAGMAGIIKTALAIYNRQLPKSLFDDAENHHALFNKNGLGLINESGNWPNMKVPLIAGVSGFGFAGTNAHVVLSEAPETSDKNHNIDTSVQHVWQRNRYWISLEKTKNSDSNQSLSKNHFNPEKINALIEFNKEDFSKEIKKIISLTLGIQIEKLNIKIPLVNLGLDSMMGLEINNQLEEKFNIKIPAVKIFGGETLEQLIEYCVDKKSQLGEMSADLDMGEKKICATDFKEMLDEIERMTDLDIEKELESK